MIIDSKNSHFYSASIFYRSLINGKYLPENIWEEAVVLIISDSLAEATQKAINIGLSGQHSYDTATGETLTWEFVRVERVIEIDEIKDGCEIFSRFLRNSEAESLMIPFEE